MEKNYQLSTIDAKLRLHTYSIYLVGIRGGASLAPPLRAGRAPLRHHYPIWSRTCCKVAVPCRSTWGGSAAMFSSVEGASFQGSSPASTPK